MMATWFQGRATEFIHVAAKASSAACGSCTSWAGCRSTCEEHVRSLKQRI